MTFEELQAELSRHLQCAICARKVEQVRRFTQLGRLVVAFEVSCHGATETAEVPYSALETDGLRIDLVPAFGGKLLTAAGASAR